MFYKNETLGLVIDGPNTHSAGKDVDMIIDWRALHTEFMRRGQLLRATYLTPMFEDGEEHNPLVPLIDWLGYNGFDVVTQPAKIEDSENGRRIKGGNIHVKFTLAALRLAHSVDHVVLFTGDGSYAPLITEMQRMGRRVSVCCSKGVTSDCLRRKADNFIELAQLREVIGKERAA